MKDVSKETDARILIDDLIRKAGNGLQNGWKGTCPWGSGRDRCRDQRDSKTREVKYCLGKGYSHTVSYLENARSDIFTAIERRLTGKTTSKGERVMRTVNIRVSVSKWSIAGALNVTKVRLAYYYNGFDA